MHYIYLILTRTNSKFGKIIRYITKNKYNHLALSIKDDFSEIYTFARYKYNSPLCGGIVKEDINRYTLKKNVYIETRIYKIPITKQQYNKVKQLIHHIEQDVEYTYNLYSALTYPLFKGFHIYKTYTCVEFVATIMDKIGFKTSKNPWQYTPQEYGYLYEKYLFYKGDLKNVIKNTPIVDKYYMCNIPIKKNITISLKNLKSLTKRLFTHKIKRKE